MRTLYLILYLVAAICFGVAAFATTVTARADGTPRVAVTARVNLVALGLLAWVLVPLIQTIDSFD